MALQVANIVAFCKIQAEYSLSTYFRRSNTLNATSTSVWLGFIYIATRNTALPSTTIPRRSDAIQTGKLQRPFTHNFNTTTTPTENTATDTTDNHEKTIFSKYRFSIIVYSPYHSNQVMSLCSYDILPWKLLKQCSLNYASCHRLKPHKP